jgi:hypothetical protein
VSSIGVSERGCRCLLICRIIIDQTVSGQITDSIGYVDHLDGTATRPHRRHAYTARYDDITHWLSKTCSYQ